MELWKLHDHPALFNSWHAVANPAASNFFDARMISVKTFAGTLENPKLQKLVTYAKFLNLKHYMLFDDLIICFFLL